MTGWPIVKAPVSVSAAANTCVEAGIVCTIAVPSGADAESFLGAQDLRYRCMRRDLNAND